MKIILVALLMAYSSQVFAYLDPGSASLIIQGAIAAIASGITVISLYWSKFKAFFQPKKDNKESGKQDKDQ